MIRINKSVNVPLKLATDGIIETSNLINEYNTNPAQYTSGNGIPSKQLVKFVFNPKIYGDKSIKDQLIKDQHEKCCYCEGKFLEFGYGEVEHYRPKGAYNKLNDKKLTYPGYYWLAFDWNNLMFSCEKCNRSFKKNHFPLEDETKRKRNHNHPNRLEDEDRLLINPNEEDPSTFFKFKEEIPVPINNDLKGERTIKIYGLERLNDSRLEHLKIIKSLLSLVEIDETDTIELNKAAQILKINPDDLKESVILSKHMYNSVANESAKYAYCVRCKFPQLPIL